MATSSVLQSVETLAKLLCTNPACGNEAKFICGRCSLIGYCGADCQKAHWNDHRVDCNDVMSKKSWRPAWYHEGRRPTFVDGTNEHSGPQPFGFMQAFARRLHLKYFWGNMPAFDILNLHENEGDKCSEPLSICFTASGDWRNIVKTIVSLPSTFSGCLNVVVNDRDEGVVARNIIFFLLMLEDDREQAIDCAIHLTYSARLKGAHKAILTGSIRDAISCVLDKIFDKPDDTLLSKKFAIGSSSIRIILKREQWQKLVDILDSELDSETCEKSRKAVVLGRTDHVERRLFNRRQFLHRRVGAMQFMKRGILLPFGVEDTPFTEPNPTLFTRTGAWMLNDEADPLNGWDPKDMANVPNKPLPKMMNDTYGDLYFHLREVLDKFYRSIRERPIAFQLTVLPAEKLAASLKLEPTFDRVDVSNIIDEDYLGMEGCMKIGSSLLNIHNEHATLVSQFMNAIPDVSAEEDITQGIMEARQFLGLSTLNGSRYDPNNLRAVIARSLFLPFDEYFSKYWNRRKCDDCATQYGLRPRARHNIVPEWPMRLRKEFGQPEAQEDFDELLASSFTGAERYVEWQRTITTLD